ncbi:hypothetical protein LPJ61_000537 [Coemansia biformis]|uniref:Rad4-domain-containing protein n=1 Tax=Coemansia biformis TaxID=1286918 RepID=A0A9W8D0Z0_9FUNG|nr:hypothetical protein LPJ61_000537 [Coemansia biformis]
MEPATDPESAAPDSDFDDDFEDVPAAPAAPAADELGGGGSGGSGGDDDDGDDDLMLELGTVEITLGESDCEPSDASCSKRRRRAVVTSRARAVRRGHHVADLICHVVAARLLNRLCSSDDVRALALSLVPSAVADRLAQHLEPGRHAVRREWASADLRCLLSSYQALAVTRRPHRRGAGASVRDELLRFLARREATRAWHQPALLAAMLRALAFDARLCAGLTPPAPRLTVQESEEIERRCRLGEAYTERAGAHGSGDRGGSGGGSSGGARMGFDCEPTPRYWVEVFDVSSDRWMTVNAYSGAVEGPQRLAGSGRPAPCAFAYVIALDADGTMRDVTRRYAHDFVNTTLRLRLESAVGADARARTWWARWIAQWERPVASERDASEDAELEQHLQAAAMPRRIADFAANPFYVLQRNLAQNEVIHPPGPVVGTVRGESVYLRENVKRVRSHMAWMREGRVVHDEAQPAKRARSRATTTRMRMAAELADQGEPAMVDLFGERQTDPYRAPPVVDGRVPRNGYGRIDLFVPAMLPAGAAHVTSPGARRVCRELGIDAADAVVAFEFRRGVSTPVVQGVVIPSDARELVLDALRTVNDAAAASRLADQEARALDRWRLLLRALRVRADVDATFASRSARPDGISFKTGVGDHDRECDAHDTGAGFVL